jgi:hypothetical protein
MGDTVDVGDDGQGTLRGVGFLDELAALRLQVLIEGPEVTALDGKTAIPSAALYLFPAARDAGHIDHAEGGAVLDVSGLAVASAEPYPIGPRALRIVRLAGVTAGLILFYRLEHTGPGIAKSVPANVTACAEIIPKSPDTPRPYISR